MCLACGMSDDDEGLWLAYQAYLEQRGLTGFEPSPEDAAALLAATAAPADIAAKPQSASETPKPAPTNFICDET